MKKDRRLRIMWSSNGVFVPSGYGIFQRDLISRLQKDGWPVSQIAWCGLEGACIELDGLKIYPKMGNPWGDDAMVAHGRHWKADVVMPMQDIWPLNPQLLQQVNHLIPYVPIDQEPVPPVVLDKLRFAYKIVTFSKFGQKALEKHGFTSTLIQEGVDTNIFKPMDKMECRKEFNLPQDKFIFGMIGANKENPPRKGWQEALEAFKLFHDKHPDSIFFFQTNQPSDGGFPIQQYAHHLGLDNAIMYLDPYMAVFHTGSPEICKLMNCFDVLLHPSLTEGFGLVAVEAQSCGTPVIVNNCTSMPENVIPGVTGEMCETARKHLSPAMGFVYFADVNSLYEKMEKLYKADRVVMGKAARQHILDNFDIDKIYQEKWIPFYEQLQIELLGPAPIDNSEIK